MQNTISLNNNGFNKFQMKTVVICSTHVLTQQPCVGAWYGILQQVPCVYICCGGLLRCAHQWRKCLGPYRRWAETQFLGQNAAKVPQPGQRIPSTAERERTQRQKLKLHKTSYFRKKKCMENSCCRQVVHCHTLSRLMCMQALIVTKP